jgi:drug/metabolite transporter (DMT)-like permease
VHRPHAATLFQAAVALVLFGCIPVVVRYVSANPYTIGIVRLSIATVGLVLIIRLREKLPRVSRRDLLRLAVIGFFFFAHWLLYFLAIKTSSASVGAIGLSTFGIQLLLLGAIAGRSRLHAVDVIAVVLAVVGAIAVVPALTLDSSVAIGMLLASVSAFFYASLPILHQRWSHLPTTTRAVGQFAFALMFFLFLLPKAEWSLRPIDWAGLLFLGLGSTLIGHTLWVRVTTELSPNATSVIYYGNLPVALVLSVVVLDERLTGRMLIGAVLIAAGSILGLASQWRRGAVLRG